VFCAVMRRPRFPPQRFDASAHKDVCDGRSVARVGRSEESYERSGAERDLIEVDCGVESRVKAVRHRHRNTVLSRHFPRPTPDCRSPRATERGIAVAKRIRACSKRRDTDCGSNFSSMSTAMFSEKLDSQHKEQKRRLQLLARVIETKKRLTYFLEYRTRYKVHIRNNLSVELHIYARTSDGFNITNSLSPRELRYVGPMQWSTACLSSVRK